MSAKTARQTRKALSPHRFPALKQAQLDALVTGAITDLTSDVDVDHNRRIRRLSKSQKLTIADAVTRHCQRIKLTPKPIA